ncbi:MAG: tetratricopeptide repeat protein [Eubacterium sp.]|nr:tetratricopeptide repeat protein [Eubacterium sp.]
MLEQRNKLGIWEILKTEPTRDPEVLKKAYRRQLVKVHPEDDPEGFQALRAAYEEAVRLAQQPEEPDGPARVPEDSEGRDAGSEQDVPLDLNTPEGRIRKTMQEIYASFFRRVQVSEWEALLADPYFSSIDTAEDAIHLLLDFIMEHYMLPHQVFRFLREQLSLDDRREELLEHYPFRYLDYLTANAIFPDAVDYTLFSGPEDYDYDGLIELASEFSRANKAGDLKRQEQLLSKLENLPVRNPDLEVLKCRYLWQAEKKEEAEEKLHALEAEYPESINVLITLGDILQHTDRLDEAEAYYQKARKYPNMDRFLRGRFAELMIRRGEYEKARDAFFDLLQEMPYDNFYRSEVLLACEGIIREKKALLEQDPSDIKARVELAAAHYQSYQFEEAIRVLEAVQVPQDPVRKAGYFNYLGRSLLSLHRTVEALSALQQWNAAISEIPEEDTSEETIAARKRAGYAQTLIGVAYMQMQRYDEAGIYIESAMTQKHDEYIVTMEERCTLEYLSGRYQAGIEACRELERRSPQNFQASNIRAKCDFELGLLQQAMEHAERAISIFPYVAEPYYILAKCYLRIKNYTEARRMAERYRQVNPESDTACLILARVAWEEKEDKAEVEKLLTPVLENMKGEFSDLEWREDVYRLMGDVHTANNNAAGAIEMYQAALKENQRSPLLHQRLAQLLKKVGRYEEALEQYRLQGEMETDPRCLLNQGFCLMQLGRHAETRDVLLMVAEIGSEDRLAMLVAGRMLLDVHFPAEAMDVLEMAVKLSSDPAEKEEVLVQQLKALILLRQYQTAQNMVSKMFEEGMNSRELVMEQIELLTCVGQFRQAEETIRAWRWRPEEKSRMYDLLCRVRFQAGDLEGLTQLLKETESYESRGISASTAYQYELLGHLQLLKKKYKEAEQNLLAASNRKPNLKYRYLGYMAECAARQFSGRGRMQRYVASLEHTWNTVGEPYEARIRLAQALRAEKSYARAHRILEEVFRMLPETEGLNRVVSEAYEELGWLYLAEKKNGEALLAFQKADDSRGYDASLKSVISRLQTGRD